VVFRLPAGLRRVALSLTTPRRSDRSPGVLPGQPERPYRTPKDAEAILKWHIPAIHERWRKDLLRDVAQSVPQAFPGPELEADALENSRRSFLSLKQPFPDIRDQVFNGLVIGRSPVNLACCGEAGKIFGQAQGQQDQALNAALRGLLEDVIPVDLRFGRDQGSNVAYLCKSLPTVFSPMDAKV